MESEVGIFYLELESKIILNDNYSLSKLDTEESSMSDDTSNSEEFDILDDIKKIVNKGKQLIMKFDTEYLHFYANFIIKKHPIYSEILKTISECVIHKDQYEILFSFNNDIITVEIINDEIIESCLKNAISLSSFYDFCLIVQDIVIFITID